MKMNKKITFRWLLYNDKVLAVISVLLAAIIWLVVAVEYSPEVTVQLKSIPVTIDESVSQALKMKPYGTDGIVVDVEISGRKIDVNADDNREKFTIIAKPGYIGSAGQTELTLEPRLKDGAEFTVTSITPNIITAYFDTEKETEFAVEPLIESSGSMVADGYYADDFIIADTATIKLTGPETEINRIEKVVARGSIKGNLTQSVTIDAQIEAVTSDGKELQYVSFNRNNMETQITIPVYKKVRLDTAVSFLNKPSGYMNGLPFDIKISPGNALFGVPEAKLEGIESFEIASIDFSKLNVGENKFTVSASDINGGIVLDGTEKFEVTVDVREMSELTLTDIKNFSKANEPKDVKTEIVSPEFDKIVIIGPDESVSGMTADSVELIADLSGIEGNFDGTVSVPVKINSPDCWLYGEYNVWVSCTK